MSASQLIALPVKDYAAAKRQFVEIYGSPIVMNTYLKIALLCGLPGVLGGISVVSLEIRIVSRKFKRIAGDP